MAPQINSALHTERSPFRLPARRSLTALLLVAVTVSTEATQQPPASGSSTGAITFAKDIAPILFDHCVNCHRPGALAPMSLQSYSEVRPWARSIRARVIARDMPPWKPVPGYGDEFVGDRRLTDEQVTLIQHWVDDGAIEGNAHDTPAVPRYPVGWQLGEPDLILAMPVPYTLRAGPDDVLRKFAIPIPINNTRYVRGLEFQPGNAQVVHHANLKIDPTSASRQLDAADPEPGYEGVTPFSARFPSGYFLGWTPGQLRPLNDESMSWELTPGSDMLVELHLMPAQQPQVVRSRVGLFFADTPPTRVPALIRLGRQDIDIPAGETAFVSRDSYVLPVDVEIHGVQPHAHYRAKQIHGFATLPNGDRRWLIRIDDWDFDWQDFYTYARPFLLPKGTALTTEITYDNSVNNRRNPQSPPRRVTWGQGSMNEMGDLWIQALPSRPADLAVLNADRRPQELTEDLVGFEMVLQADPDQPVVHDDAALLYLQFGQIDEAVAHFRESARLRPDSAAAQYNLGTTLLQLGAAEEAVGHLEQALTIDPGYIQAHNNLGAALRSLGRFSDAIRRFRQALLASPDDAEARYNLANALAQVGEFDEALTHYQQVVLQQPDVPEPFAELAWLLITHPDPTRRDPGNAVRLAAHATALTNDEHPGMLDVLAAAYAATGQFEHAVATAETALRLVASAPDESSAVIRQRLDGYKRRLSGRPPG